MKDKIDEKNDDKIGNIYLDAIDVFEYILFETGDDGVINLSFKQKVKELETRANVFEEDLKKKCHDELDSLKKKYWSFNDQVFYFYTTQTTFDYSDSHSLSLETLPSQSDYFSMVRAFAHDHPDEYLNFLRVKLPQQAEAIHERESEITKLESSKPHFTVSFFIFLALAIISIVFNVTVLVLGVHSSTLPTWLYLICLFGFVPVPGLFLMFAFIIRGKQRQNHRQRIDYLKKAVEDYKTSYLCDIVPKMYREYEKWISSVQEMCSNEAKRILDDVELLSDNIEKALQDKEEELLSRIKPNIAEVFKRVRELPLEYQNDFIFECRVSVVSSEADILRVYKGLKNDWEEEKTRQRIIEDNAKANEESIKIQKERQNEERMAHKNQYDILQQQAENARRANEEQLQILKQQKEKLTREAEKQTEVLKKQYQK